MTNREAYVFGRVLGRLSAAACPQEIGENFTLVAQRPYTASARAASGTRRFELLEGDLDRQIGETLCEIISIDPPMGGGSEKLQPLEIQGAWQVGYFAGKDTRLLTPAELGTAAARKAKNLAQAQLVDAMGVDQVVASRWESDKVSPNTGNLTKLKELLG